MTKPVLAKPVVTLPYNTKGRDFVVGDIHGIFNVLDDALKAVNFDPARDRLISVGDLVDRGALSHKVLDYLGQPWFYAIGGNHEHMFLRCLRDGQVDKQRVSDLIPHGFGWILEQPLDHLLKIKAAFEKLPLVIQVEAASGKEKDRIGFVHADVPEGWTWPQFIKGIEEGKRAVIETAVWSRRRVEERDASGVPGISRIFLGHTVQFGVQQLGNCFFIDTGGVFRAANQPNAMFYYLLLSETNAPASLLTAPHLLSTSSYRAVQTPAQKQKPHVKFKPPRP